MPTNTLPYIMTTIKTHDAKTILQYSSENKVIIVGQGVMSYFW